jgi:hypothetical protein
VVQNESKFVLNLSISDFSCLHGFGIDVLPSTNGDTDIREDEFEDPTAACAVKGRMTMAIGLSREHSLLESVVRPSRSRSWFCSKARFAKFQRGDG